MHLKPKVMPQKGEFNTPNEHVNGSIECPLEWNRKLGGKGLNEGDKVGFNWNADKQIQFNQGGKAKNYGQTSFSARQSIKTEALN